MTWGIILLEPLVTADPDLSQPQHHHQFSLLNTKRFRFSYQMDVLLYSDSDSEETKCIIKLHTFYLLRKIIEQIVFKNTYNHL